MSDRPPRLKDVALQSIFLGFGGVIGFLLIGPWLVDTIGLGAGGQFWKAPIGGAIGAAVGYYAYRAIFRNSN